VRRAGQAEPKSRRADGEVCACRDGDVSARRRGRMGNEQSHSRDVPGSAALCKRRLGRRSDEIAIRQGGHQCREADIQSPMVAAVR
jgi:hypothetical protein